MLTRTQIHGKQTRDKQQQDVDVVLRWSARARSPARTTIHVEAFSSLRRCVHRKHDGFTLRRLFTAGPRRRHRGRGVSPGLSRGEIRAPILSFQIKVALNLRERRGWIICVSIAVLYWNRCVSSTKLEIGVDWCTHWD